MYDCGCQELTFYNDKVFSEHIQEDGFKFDAVLLIFYLINVQNE